MTNVSSCSARFDTAVFRSTPRTPSGRKTPKGSKDWPQDTQGFSRKTLQVLPSMPGEPLTHSLDSRSKDAFLPIETTRNRRPLGLPSQRRDPRHLRVYRSRPHPDSRAPSTRHEIFRRLFFESTRLPKKTTAQPSISRRRRLLEIPQRTELSPKNRAALRKSWAQLIKRVYLTDPLKCECGGTLRVIAFITEHKAVQKILDHLKGFETRSRPPPQA